MFEATWDGEHSYFHIQQQIHHPIVLENQNISD